ncbi:MAG: ATP-binding protein [Deltaproteobacteria bacterium]|nr:ATP-binding protein [Deltaproteobacteria bacterium]
MTTPIERWLDVELDRLWLIGERRLRRMQCSGVDFSASPAFRAIEALLAARRDRPIESPSARLIEIERALAACTDPLWTARAAAPIGALVTRLALSSLELDTLVATFAPLVDPPLADLFALVHSRRGVDLGLLGELFELDRRRRLALLATVDADRPLVRWSMLSLDGSGSSATPVTHRQLQVSPDVISTLSSGRELPSGLLPYATLRTARPELDDLILAAPLRRELEAIASGFAVTKDTSKLPWVVLWGPSGAGRREIATRIAAASGRDALVFDPSNGNEAEVLARLHLAQREALIRGAALVVGPIPENLAQPITEALRRYPELAFLVMTGTHAPKIATDRALHEIALGPLCHADATQLWARAMESISAGELDLGSLIDGYRLTPGDILQAVKTADASARAQARAVRVADLRLGVELRLRTQLGDLVERVEGTHSWSDLVLPDADLDRLFEFLGRKRHASVVYEKWGLANRIRYGKGMIALFSGPPGTGKTMVAGVIASELSMDLYRVDLSQVVSKWAGETEKQLAQIFDIAERTQAVLLFDEADSLFAKRGSTEGGNDRFANLTVNYLLQRLERYPGVAVLTTNKEESLDEALQRRLSLHLRLQLPEVAERRRLWRSFLPDQLPGASTIDVDWLANRFPLAGGSIKNAAVRAAFLAAGDGQPLDLAVVVASVERELDDMGRVVWQLPFTPADEAIELDDVILD